MAQTLPVDWNGIPGVLDLHVIPRYKRHCEVSEEQGGAEGEHGVPVVSELHEYRKSATNVEFRRLEVETLRVSSVSVFEVKIEMKMRMKIEMREPEISESHQIKRDCHTCLIGQSRAFCVRAAPLSIHASTSTRNMAVAANTSCCIYYCTGNVG
jgi:PIN domain nuclease of toxin-antitoxin system